MRFFGLWHLLQGTSVTAEGVGNPWNITEVAANNYTSVDRAPYHRFQLIASFRRVTLPFSNIALTANKNRRYMLLQKELR